MKILIVIVFLLPIIASAQLAVYFNKSVDTSLAYPPGNFAQANRDFSQIVRDQLDKARYSIDMAMYSLNVPAVVEGLIAAKNRGVKVRVIGHVENIHDAGMKFSQLIANGIPVASNPVSPTGQQPLMHDKFFVIDARRGASSGTAPTVITGSWNATSQQTYYDANNLLVIADSAISAAYLKEFEEMWGGSADTFNVAQARFGSAKSDNTDHDFTLGDGTHIELRFSPSDMTSSHISAALSTGESSIYTANLTFTYQQLASTLQNRHNTGVDVRSIIDNVDDQGSQFNYLKTFAEVYDWQLNGLLHHKYAVVDAVPLGSGSDPVVITGSHNWTFSAEMFNDENALVIHNAKIANQYLQEFAARYHDVGGTRPFVVQADVHDAELDDKSFSLQVTSTLGSVVLRTSLAGNMSGEIIIYDMLGHEVERIPVSASMPIVLWKSAGYSSGVYFATLNCAGASRTVMIQLVK